MCYVIGLWLFYRSHADLGTNWSITLEVREEHRLITDGVYRAVRHPMYLGFLIAFWVAPVMTVSHLLFALGTTAYILIAVRFEERDLVSEFGKDYLDYQERVGMLLPVKRGR